MADDQTIGELLAAKEPTAEQRELELRVAKRRELLDHVDFLVRPPAKFYSDLEMGSSWPWGEAAADWW